MSKFVQVTLALIFKIDVDKNYKSWPKIIGLRKQNLSIWNKLESSELKYQLFFIYYFPCTWLLLLFLICLKNFVAIVELTWLLTDAKSADGHIRSIIKECLK